MRKEVLLGIATLMGTIIGAGILGIPYVISKAGFLTGAFVIIFLGICAMGMNLALGEVILRTDGKHQLTGYAEKYLGKKGKYLMAVSMFIGLYGAMIAYLIGIGESLHAIFGFWTPFKFTILFLLLIMGVIYAGLKLVEEFELFIGSFIFLSMVVFVFILFRSPDFLITRTFSFSFSKLFLPYGVILFSYLGAVSLPEVKEGMIYYRDQFKKAIVIGSLLPIIMYLIFSFSMVAVFGINVTEIATIGLGQYFGSYMLIFTNFFAFLTLTGSFLALSLAMKEQYMFDYKINHGMSWFLTIILPITVIILGFRDFISTIGFAGSIAGGIDGILIILMLWKSRELGDRKPEYNLGKFRFFGVLIIFVFVLGLLFQILSLFGYFQ